jgi:hemerythrin-like domain-containing protein|uniref:Hemerythrin domain-containing protein n=1 Tax=Acidicaldus sp. TaxID=1872105 RepID=A0A8J4HAF7_9PROT
MMETHVARALHDEHQATLALLARLEALLGQHGPAVVPDAAAAPVATLLRALARAVALEIGPHFAFEEIHLFPLLADSGAAEMVALLSAEHAAIIPYTKRLAELARQGQLAGFDAVSWAAFHAAGAALAGSLAAHVEKEEMGLLPALDALLDAETDGRLALELAALR